jgi:hypothetical protein
MTAPARKPARAAADLHGLPDLSAYWSLSLRQAEKLRGAGGRSGSGQKTLRFAFRYACFAICDYFRFFVIGRVTFSPRRANEWM